MRRIVVGAFPSLDGGDAIARRTEGGSCQRQDTLRGRLRW
jgi:hypothetical protein